jgi:hypothetical protein
MYLYFGSYTLIDNFKVLILDEPQIGNSSVPSYVSITVSFLLINPSSFTVKVAYVEETLYLNEQKLGGPVTLSLYGNPIQLNPNATLSITIDNVPSEKVFINSPKSWMIHLFILVLDIPLVDRGYFSRTLYWPT